MMYININIYQNDIELGFFRFKVHNRETLAQHYIELLVHSNLDIRNLDLVNFVI